MKDAAVLVAGAAKAVGALLSEADAVAGTNTIAALRQAVVAQLQADGQGGAGAKGPGSGAAASTARRCAGVCSVPTSFARSSSSDGSFDKDSMPETSSIFSPRAPPMMASFSLSFEKVYATLDAATGSFDVARPAGPFSIGPMPS